MRYAIYFTPPADDALTLAAARWLGRDAFTGTATLPAVTSQSASEHQALVAEPQRYGFHATLKAPFRLADSAKLEELTATLATFGRRTPGFAVQRLEISRLGNFFAIVPANPSPALEHLAWQVVTEFDRFRAPLSAAELARRRPEHLNDRQRDYLQLWGYPYVNDEFRFHMTLTGSVDPSAHERTAALLAQTFGGLLGAPLAITQIALFVEAVSGAPFQVHSVYPLA